MFYAYSKTTSNRLIMKNRTHSLTLIPVKEALKQFIINIAHFLQKLQFFRKNQKEVLLICNGPLMALYLSHILKIFKDDPRLNFSYFEYSSTNERSDSSAYISKKLKARRVTSKRAFLKKWDLIVVADHAMPSLIDSQGCPTIYMGHGLESGKIVNNEYYTLGSRSIKENGECRYSSFLFASNYMVEYYARNKVPFTKLAFVSGDPIFDELLKRQEKRASIRHNLGIEENQIVVYVMSTWGPNCLWQSIGDKMLEQMKKLQKKYRFILGAHPNEYRPQNNGKRTWGLHLQEQKEFLVLNPDKDYKNYLTACDVIVSDHTSLILYGALLSRPLVIMDLDKALIEEESLTSRLMEISPKLKKDASNLESSILDAINNYSTQERNLIHKDIISYPGENHDRVRTHVYNTLGIPSL
jgi:hypothetical protein